MAEEKKEVKDGKVVVQVTQASVSKRKATIGERLAKTFLSEENVDNVGDYLLNDVVIPAIKDTIVDFIQKGTDMLFYGETKSRSGRRRGADDRENYNRISTVGGRSSSSRSSGGYSRRDYNRVYRGYESVYLESRGDAEEVIDNLTELVLDYKCVSVADLYDLVGLPSVHTDNKWGWYDVTRASIRRVRGGWTIDLPEPEPLD